MKKINIDLMIIIILLCIALFGLIVSINAINNENKNKIKTINDTIYIEVLDTLNEKLYINKLDSIDKEFINYKNSVNKELDSLKSENFINNYKLERIKYYTDISNGTNIKYLRGWIYRTLKD